ncbi:MAG: nucleotide pyrophosphohydrolase [Candidatus Babeliales bacterium]|jgi:NTP pyrophosphatase (non-canonical NTP hydrolase)
MADQQKTVQELKDFVNNFVKEREWNQFHNAKSLSMAIAIEAAELMEHFLWINSHDSENIVTANRSDIEDEMADVMITLLCLCNAYNVDISDAMERKMVINKKKYPVEKAKGRYDKYTKL